MTAVARLIAAGQPSAIVDEGPEWTRSCAALQAELDRGRGRRIRMHSRWGRGACYTAGEGVWGGEFVGAAAWYAGYMRGAMGLRCEREDESQDAGNAAGL
jgi:hypothetical protein